MNIHSKSFLACLLIVVFTACASRAVNHLPLPEDIPGMPTEQMVEAAAGSLVSISQTETESLRESLTKQVTDLGVKTEDLNAFGISYDGARTDFMVVPPIILDKEAQEYQNERLFIKQGKEWQELTMRISDMTTILVPVGEGSVMRPVAIWGLEGEKEENFQPVLMYVNITADDFQQMTERQRESFEFNYFSPNKNGEGKTVIVTARGADPAEGTGKLLAKVAVEPVKKLSPENQKLIQDMLDYELPATEADKTVGPEIIKNFFDLLNSTNQSGDLVDLGELQKQVEATGRPIIIEAFTPNSGYIPSVCVSRNQHELLKEQGVTVVVERRNISWFVHRTTGERLPSNKYFFGKSMGEDLFNLNDYFTAVSIMAVFSNPDCKGLYFPNRFYSVVILVAPRGYSTIDYKENCVGLEPSQRPVFLGFFGANRVFNDGDEDIIW